MDQLNLGLRTQDFHEGLRETKTFGPREAYFGNTLLIGKAAVLAMHLRGLLYVDDETVLKFAAGQLGIGALELPTILKELEEIDFVSVVRSGDTIKRVDIRVPEFRTGYEELGERWKTLKPVGVEVLIALNMALSCFSEKVAITFLGGLGILILAKGFELIISSRTSHDQKARIALR